MKGAVNQHAGVRGQEEEAGLYKPEVATLLTLCVHIPPSSDRRRERKTKREKEAMKLQTQQKQQERWRRRRRDSVERRMDGGMKGGWKGGEGSHDLFRGGGGVNPAT